MNNLFGRLLALALSCVVTLQAGALDNWLVKLWKGDNPQPPSVKILIVHDQPGVILEVKGKYQLYDPNTGDHISTRFIGKRKFIQPITDGLKWDEEFPDIHQLKVVPDSLMTTTLVDGIEYKGNIYVYDIGGALSIVNEVTIEDFLRSILSDQFDRPIPREALNAIVIAARTNTYYLADNPKNTFWAVEAHRFGYEGSSGIHKNNEIEKSLDETKNMVMVRDGDVFGAEWGSSTGGQSNKEENSTFSRISLYEAEEMARNGQNAAQILTKAFPGSAIKLIDRLK